MGEKDHGHGKKGEDIWETAHKQKVADFSLHQSWLLVFTMRNNTSASPSTLRYFFLFYLEHSHCLQDRVRGIRL